MLQGIIASFKIQYKKKVLQWVLSQYDNATLKDLRKMMPNIRQAIMWSHEVWSELDAQIVKNCWRITYFKSSSDYLYLFGVISYYFIQSLVLKLVVYVCIMAPPHLTLNKNRVLTLKPAAKCGSRVFRVEPCLAKG